MGCAASCLSRTTMTLFGRQSSNDDMDKTAVERKIYLAKEFPGSLFDLSNCQLRQVPTGTFTTCKVLRKELIYFNHNRLQTLDHGGLVADLFLITVLNISFNQFNCLTPEIKHLINLSELYLQNNELGFIPDEIAQLTRLRILDISNNKLKVLTPSIGKLKNLQILKLQGNEYLHELCKELCHTRHLVSLEVDIENFTFPSAEIMAQGIVAIKQYLCQVCNIEYKEPNAIDEASVVDGNKQDIYNPFIKKTSLSWEEQEALSVDIEIKIHEASRKQRNRFLSKVMQDQSEIEKELAKIQEARDCERQKLIKTIQLEEKEVECLVKNFMQSTNLKPEMVNQQLLHEQAEHDYLLSIIRQNYDNIKKTDVLKSMENIINENYTLVTKNKSNKGQLNALCNSMLVEDLECSEKINELLRAKDESRSHLVEQLLEDQAVQKAVVASLIEQVDSRTWCLNQEISMVSYHLAQLSMIEQEKKRMTAAYNFNELSDQRMQLLVLLDDLIGQKKKRKDQLLQTLKEIETQSTAPDFWLKNYQKLIESAPQQLLDSGKKIDPILANCLLQEGVIHCLPFLVKFLFSNSPLNSITDEMLKENGVSMSQDRFKILKCIEYYLTDKIGINNNLPTTSTMPSAPNLEDVNTLSGVVESNTTENSDNNECVICMDAICNIVFVPCGHLCCCLSCSEKDVTLCPMCRVDIERKIKVIPA